MNIQELLDPDTRSEELSELLRDTTHGLVAIVYGKVHPSFNSCRICERTIAEEVVDIIFNPLYTDKEKATIDKVTEKVQHLVFERLAASLYSDE